MSPAVRSNVPPFNVDVAPVRMDKRSMDPPRICKATVFELLRDEG
jgi:hypothetical protein